MTTLHQVFRQLYDPRINRSKKHLLIDIVILSILAVLSGAESYDSIELFGKTNYAFLKQFLKLPHAAENFAIVRKITLNLLKKDKGKGRLVTKRLKAAWDKECLIKLLQI